MSWVGKATRIDVLGMVVPLRTKQNPRTPLAVVLYGCWGGPSLSSNAIPAPHAFVAVDVIPDVHILPPTFGKALASVGGVTTVEQLTSCKSLQSLY